MAPEVKKATVAGTVGILVTVIGILAGTAWWDRALAAGDIERASHAVTERAALGTAIRAENSRGFDRIEKRLESIERRQEERFQLLVQMLGR